MLQTQSCSVALKNSAAQALESAIDAGLAGYDRRRVLARFHRLSAELIDSPAPDAARRVVAEIDAAMRKERARAGHWSYDLNRHIALMIAHKAESARLRLLLAPGGGQSERFATARPHVTLGEGNKG